jgi:serine/threonine protein kinase
MTGDTISHYKVLGKLGEGGMGTVYKARDTRLNRLVAVKVLLADKTTDLERRRRFIQEAQSASMLNHPNIITIYDIGTENGADFIVMEYVSGKALNELISSNGLRPPEILKYAVQIADALVAAHGAGIIHRDLKPGNVMVTDSGIIKVLDFGLAKLTDPSGIGELDDTLTAIRQAEPATQAGVVLGTVAYMSPEQAEAKKVDARSDIFSFGAVLYEMVTGHRAFERGSTLQTLTAVVREDPKPVSILSPQTSFDMERVINRCLRKDVSDRYQSALDLKGALVENQRGSARPADGKPSVGVLPFINMNRDDESEFFSDGLAEEIITALSRVEGLRVASRAAAFKFKVRNVEPREIGRKLQVDTLLEGTVRRAGTRLRVTVELIKVDDDSLLWSQRFDREMTDVFEIQDQISREIVEVLRVKLARGQQRLVERGTTNIEAYELYLKGQFHRYKLFNPEGFRKSIGFFEQAIEKDPLYADAHASLAGIYYAFGVWGWSSPPEALPRPRPERGKLWRSGRTRPKLTTCWEQS